MTQDTRCGQYEDIIYLPHPVSKVRPQMPISDRAAQFSPFAALTGYDVAIREAARLTDKSSYSMKKPVRFWTENSSISAKSLPRSRILPLPILCRMS